MDASVLLQESLQCGKPECSVLTRIIARRLRSYVTVSFVSYILLREFGKEDILYSYRKFSGI